jgi:ribose transport system permease protein
MTTTTTPPTNAPQVAAPVPPPPPAQSRGASSLPLLLIILAPLVSLWALFAMAAPAFAAGGWSAFVQTTLRSPHFILLALVHVVIVLGLLRGRYWGWKGIQLLWALDVFLKVMTSHTHLTWALLSVLPLVAGMILVNTRSTRQFCNTDQHGPMTEMGSLIGLLFVATLFAVLSKVVDNASPFATADNLELMCRQTSVVGIAALGMTLIIISGGIDLSVGSNIALSTIVLAQVLNMMSGRNGIVPAIAGVATAAAAGLLIGTLITGLRLSPFIITLGMWGSLRGLATGLAGNQSVYPNPPGVWRQTFLNGLISNLPAGKRWMLVPPGVWMLIILAILVGLMLRYTRFGRHIFAIGSNEQTARLCGIAIDRTKIQIYALAGALVGLASVLEFSYVGIGNPTGRTGAELDVIAAVVIGGASLSGGQGSVFGALIGALIMTMVANGCTKLGLPNWVQQIATGVIIVIAVSLDRFRHRRAA